MNAIITSRPTDRQVEALRTGTRDAHGVIAASAGKRTHEGLVGRGLAEWTLSEDIYESDSMWGKTLCVITRQGRAYLAKLDDVKITRADVEEGKRQALAWLGYGERRREAEKAPASVVLKGEFARIRRVMRRAMRNAGAEAANNALNQYNRTEALLIAARRFDQEDAATAAEKGSNVQEQQEQTAPVVTRLAVARNESGMGHSLKVEFVLTAHYADREPVRMPAMSVKGLHANTSAANMPEAVTEQLARHGGMAYRVEGGWTLVDPDGEAARLAGDATREEVEEARRTVLASLSESYRDGLRNKPASVVLAHEFTHTRREAARYERVSGAGDLEAMRARHLRAGALLEAARRFELEPAEEAPREPAEFRGLTRDDVARDAAEALETLSAEDRSIVEGKAPSVVLGIAFTRAQTAWCADRRERTPEEQDAYERKANVASAAFIFEKADGPEAARAAMADYQRILNEERAAEAKRYEEARERALMAEWADSERHGKYRIRTEDRGHGIIAVYAIGPVGDMASIDRAANQYARQNLTFEDGLSAGAATGGGECFKGEYIAQQVYTTKRLAPRED